MNGTAMKDNYTDWDDETLVREYVSKQSGTALGVLFERYADTAYAAALRITRNADDAEDAVQSAFIRIMKNLHLFRGEASVKTWILKNVVSECKNKIRGEVRRRRREKHSSEQRYAAADGSGPPAEFSGLVKKYLDSLPEIYRTSVWLRHHDGLSFREIAHALSVSENTARTRTSRGIARLRDQFSTAPAALSASMLISALEQAETEAAPAALLQKISGIVRGTSPAGTSERGPAYGRSAARASKGRLLPLAKPLVLIGTGLLIGGGIWLGTREKGSGPTSPPTAESREGFSYSIPFNSANNLELFELITGRWTHIPGQGINGSGCVECRAPRVAAVFRKPVSLPLRITLQFRLSSNPRKISSRTDTGIVFGWHPFRTGAIFKNIGPLNRTGASKWQKMTFFITEKYLARYTNQTLDSLILQERVPQSRLTLFCYEVEQKEHRQQIDNLKMESVSPDQLPDLGRYLQAFEDIPPEKRTGKVILTGLQARRNKEVHILFSTPGQDAPE